MVNIRLAYFHSVILSKCVNVHVLYLSIVIVMEHADVMNVRKLGRPSHDVRC